MTNFPSIDASIAIGAGTTLDYALRVGGERVSRESVGACRAAGFSRSWFAKRSKSNATS